MLAIGRILYTRDGRSVGNGIILKRDYSSYLGVVYTVKTDFGNLIRLTRREINSLFYLGTVAHPQKQLHDQLRLLYLNFPPKIG
jgi:hypothetical protein